MTEHPRPRVAAGKGRVLAGGALAALTALGLGGFFMATEASCTRNRNAHLTRVQRAQVVRVGDPDVDLFFAVVRAMQYAVNEAERVRFDTTTELSLRLGLGDGAEVGTAAAEVRRLALALAALHGQFLVMEREVRLQPYTWGPLEYPPTQARAECSVRISTRHRGQYGDEPVSADSLPLVNLVERAVRHAAALEGRMEGVAIVAPALRDAGQTLARTSRERLGARAAALVPEFAAADEFLAGLPARASTQALQARSIVNLLSSSATVVDAVELGAPMSDGGTVPQPGSTAAPNPRSSTSGPTDPPSGAQAEGPDSGLRGRAAARAAVFGDGGGLDRDGESSEDAHTGPDAQHPGVHHDGGHTTGRHHDATVHDAPSTGDMDAGLTPDADGRIDAGAPGTINEAGVLEGDGGRFPDGAVRLGWIIGVYGHRVSGRDRRALQRLTFLPPLPTLNCSSGGWTPATGVDAGALIRDGGPVLWDTGVFANDGAADVPDAGSALRDGATAASDATVRPER